MKLLSAKYSQRRFFRTNAGLQRGQGMVEYIIIGALIAIAAIAIYSAWGKTMRLQSAGLAGEIAGKKLDMELVKDSANAAGGTETVKLVVAKNDFI